MKKILTAVAAVALLGSTAQGALAQDGRRDRGDRGDGAGRSERSGEAQPDRGGGGDYNPAVRRSWRNTPDNAPPAPAAAPAPQVQAPVAVPVPAPQARGDRDGRQGRADDGRRAREDNRGDNRDWNDRNRGDNRDWNDRGRGDNRDWTDRNRGDNRSWNDRDNRNWSDQRRAERPRYDRRAYPSVYRLDRRFQGPRYRPPSGFYVRSWSYGQILPRGWYAQQYRILDWWSYDLPIPPVGYDWVRVGDDVLLVDTYTGRVVQVVYDAFW